MQQEVHIGDLAGCVQKLKALNTEMFVSRTWAHMNAERLRAALQSMVDTADRIDIDRPTFGECKAMASARSALAADGEGEPAHRPPTPVGWSDTDWLKHLEEIRQDQEIYHRGPLPETGWD